MPGACFNLSPHTVHKIIEYHVLVVLGHHHFSNFSHSNVVSTVDPVQCAQHAQQEMASWPNAYEKHMLRYMNELSGFVSG